MKFHIIYLPISRFLFWLRFIYNKQKTKYKFYVYTRTYSLNSGNQSSLAAL